MINDEYYHLNFIIGSPILEHTGGLSGNVGGLRTFPSRSNVGGYVHADLNNPSILGMCFLSIAYQVEPQYIDIERTKLILQIRRLFELTGIHFTSNITNGSYLYFELSKIHYTGSITNGSYIYFELSVIHYIGNITNISYLYFELSVIHYIDNITNISFLYFELFVIHSTGNITNISYL